MPVQIENQFKLKFSVTDMIGDFDDFISGDELSEFRLIENTGNILPAWELSFVTTNNKVISACQENHTISVSMGHDDYDYTTDLKISAYRIEPVSSSQLKISLTGLLDAYNYITAHAMYDQKASGVEVILAVAGEYFSVNANTGSSQDMQVWNRGSRTGKQFVDELLMHSWAGSTSWFAAAINHKGEFIIKDMSQNISSGEVFTFDVTGLAGGPQFTTPPILVGKPGMLNMIGGYQREFWIYDRLEGGLGELSSIGDATSLMATGSVLNRANLSSKIFSGHMSLNENVHEKYWDAMKQFYMYNASYSTNKMIVTFGENIAINPLDMVLATVEDKDNQTSSNYQTGYWVTGDVIRSIKNRAFSTTVHLYREALNSNQG